MHSASLMLMPGIVVLSSMRCWRRGHVHNSVPIELLRWIGLTKRGVRINMLVVHIPWSALLLHKIWLSRRWLG